MPNNLQEKINEVMEQFDENFTEVEFLHGVPVDLPIEYKQWLKAFITQHIHATAQFTYERIRPEEKTLPAGATWRGETPKRQIYSAGGHNSCLSQLDANWNAWKGEV